MTSQIMFPKWFGSNSTCKKWNGLLHQLQVHSIQQASATDSELGLSYVPLLSRRLLTPLLEKEEEGIDEIVEFMGLYGLNKEDRDSVFHLDHFKTLRGDGKKDDAVPSKLKAKLSRAYNASPYSRLYSEKITKGSSEPTWDNEDEEEVVEEEDGGLEGKEEDPVGANVVMKGKKAKGKASATASGRGRGGGGGATRGRGRGIGR